MTRQIYIPGHFSDLGHFGHFRWAWGHNCIIHNLVVVKELKKPSPWAPLENILLILKILLSHNGCSVYASPENQLYVYYVLNTSRTFCLKNKTLVDQIQLSPKRKRNPVGDTPDLTFLLPSNVSEAPTLQSSNSHKTDPFLWKTITFGILDLPGKTSGTESKPKMAEERPKRENENEWRHMGTWGPHWVLWGLKGTAASHLTSLHSDRHCTSG